MLLENISCPHSNTQINCVPLPNISCRLSQFSPSSVGVCPQCCLLGNLSLISYPVDVLSWAMFKFFVGTEHQSISIINLLRKQVFSPRYSVKSINAIFSCIIIYVNPFPTDFLKLYATILLKFCVDNFLNRPIIFNFLFCLLHSSLFMTNKPVNTYILLMSNSLDKWMVILGFAMCILFLCFIVIYLSWSLKSFNNLSFSIFKSYVLPYPSKICFTAVPHWSIYSNYNSMWLILTDAPFLLLTVNHITS